MTGIAIHDLQIGDAGWLILQHARLYARDEGFDASFEATVAEVLAGFIRHRDPTGERAFIAWQGTQRLGSIFCTREDDRTARLRLFLLLPEARGQGLGKRLLAECMAYARTRGYDRMVLATHKSHRAACGLYAATGWHCTSERPVTSFGKALIEMQWQVDL